MESKLEKKVVLTLKLNETETAWLKGIMQNPMWVDHPDKEAPEDKKHRELFWAALGGNKPTLR